MCVYVLVVQSCPILCDPMDCMPARLQCPWNSPDKNGVGCHSLPQGIFLTQGLNPGVSKCRKVPAGIWASRGAPVKVCTSDWNLGELPWRLQWWRGTREPLGEGERGEWNSWLKTQHSKIEEDDIWFHHFMANRWGNNGNSHRLYFLGLQNHCRWRLQPWN